MIACVRAYVRVCCLIVDSIMYILYYLKILCCHVSTTASEFLPANVCRFVFSERNPVAVCWKDSLKPDEGHRAESVCLIDDPLLWLLINFHETCLLPSQGVAANRYDCTCAASLH